VGAAAAISNESDRGGSPAFGVAAQGVPRLVGYWLGTRNTSHAQRFTFAPFASSTFAL
jgi:hypothetical protein